MDGEVMHVRVFSNGKASVYGNVETIHRVKDMTQIIQYDGAHTIIHNVEESVVHSDTLCARRGCEILSSMEPPLKPGQIGYPVF